MEFDFKKWLTQFEDNDYKEVCALYSAVKEVEEHGFFTCSEQGDAFIIQCSYMKDYPLRLASEDARKYFLDFLEKKYAGEMTMEGWCSFKERMETND